MREDDAKVDFKEETNNIMKRPQLSHEKLVFVAKIWSKRNSGKGERDGLDENDFGLNKQQLTNNNIAIKATTK